MKSEDVGTDLHDKVGVISQALNQEVRRVLFAAEQCDSINPCLDMLRSRGIEVRQVSDGRTCLDEALRGKESGAPFDIIVVAIDLPVLDGFSTAMLLRENDCARTIISTDDSEHYIQQKQSVQAGCNLHCKIECLIQDLQELLAEN